MKTLKISLLSMLLPALVLGLSAAMTVADDAPLDASSDISTTADASDEMSDPAFEMYLSPMLISEAISSNNSSMLVDCALLSREGEKALGRPHASFNSNDLCTMALKMSSENRDVNSVKRLANLLGTDISGDMKTKVDLALQLAASSRAIQPVVPVDDAAGDEVKALVASFVDQIQYAERFQMKSHLPTLKLNIEQCAELPAASKTALLKYATDVDNELTGEQDASSTQMSAFAGISDSSLEGVSRITPAPKTYKINYTITNSTARKITFSLHGSGSSYTLNPKAKGSYVATQKVGVTPYIMVIQEYVYPEPLKNYQPGQVALSVPYRPAPKKYNLGAGAWYLRDSKGANVFGR